MKFAKIDLLTLLISLFILASCEKTSTIGLQVDPSAAVQGALIDTTTIFTRTIKDDIGATYADKNGITRYPFGFLNDPVIGTTESSLAFSVNLPSDAYSFGDNPQLDSAVLVLNYGGEFYGDSTANYTIDVHQLSNNFSVESSYLSSKTYPNHPFILGTYSGKIFPSTAVKVTNIVLGDKDTVATVKPQLRIKLDNNFIINNIVSLTPNEVKYNARFQENFKGLKIQIRPSTIGSLSNGGMMFFSANSESTSALYLYYRKQNSTNSTLTDTLQVAFPINSGANAVASSIQHQYSAEVQTQLNAPNTQFPFTYLQPLAGLRNKISFPYLAKLKSNVGKVIINKAEISIDLKNGTNISPFKAAPRLSLYCNDIAGLRKNLPDNNQGDGYTSVGDPRANSSAFGGYFDSVNNRYVFVVTSYIQDLLDGKTEDYGTFLSVTPSSSFEFYNTYNTASRAIIGSYKKNPSVGDNLIKLNIYYSKIQ